MCSCSFFRSSLTAGNTIMLHLRHYPWTHILLWPSTNFLDDMVYGSYNHFSDPCHLVHSPSPFHWIPSLSIWTLPPHHSSTYSGLCILSCLFSFSSHFFYASTRHLPLIVSPCHTLLYLILTQYLCAIYFSLTKNLSIWWLLSTLVNLVHSRSLFDSSLPRNLDLVYLEFIKLNHHLEPLTLVLVCHMQSL